MKVSFRRDPAAAGGQGDYIELAMDRSGGGLAAVTQCRPDQLAVSQ
jgi:hypothetical protein